PAWLASARPDRLDAGARGVRQHGGLLPRRSGAVAVADGAGAVGGRGDGRSVRGRFAVGLGGPRLAVGPPGDSRAAAGVHPLFQLFADLEEGEALGLHADPHAGARVAPLVRLVAAQLEAAEAADLDPLPALERVLHRLEDHLHQELRPPLRDLLRLTQNVDEIRLRHRPVIPQLAQRVRPGYAQNVSNT